MTIIRPVTAQDIATKARLQEASKKAELNLSEITALNKKYGTDLKYCPIGDVVEITEYSGKKLTKGLSQFDEECFRIAESMEKKLGKTIRIEMRINDTITSSLAGNVKSALRKLKKVFKNS